MLLLLFVKSRHFNRSAINQFYFSGMNPWKMLLKNILDEDEFDYISNASSQDIGFDFKIKDLFR